MNEKSTSTYIGFFLIVCIVCTLAEDKLPQICRRGLGGVINGHVGDGSIIGGPCKNADAQCVSMTYCATSTTTPNEYEYGYMHYCQDEPVVALPLHLTRKCNATINGTIYHPETLKVCQEVQDKDYQGESIVYRMCCFQCSKDFACNTELLQLDSPCKGRQWSTKPMRRQTNTTTDPTTIKSTKPLSTMGEKSTLTSQPSAATAGIVLPTSSGCGATVGLAIFAKITNIVLTMLFPATLFTFY